MVTGESMNLFDTNVLFASMLWGSIGLGYFIYGKRQQSFVPLVAGLLMMGASYFAPSILIMSLICLGLMAAVYLLIKQGW